MSGRPSMQQLSVFLVALRSTPRPSSRFSPRGIRDRAARSGERLAALLASGLQFDEESAGRIRVGAQGFGHGGAQFT